MRIHTSQDGTEYVIDHNGTRHRRYPKPYRNKKEMKQQKRARRVGKLLWGFNSEE